MALVEQEPDIPPASTLRESLALRGRLERLADERERWRIEARLVEYLHRLGLDEAKDPTQLSGGETKRAALALAFALAPDLLLLDEPTNHLDIDAIALLEDLLLKGPALIVITHDRAFLDRVATRIVELDRGLLRSYPGNYSAWEARRATELAAEETASRKFDKFWAQEEAWIRKGIEARRTRNVGRVSRLEQLRRERTARRERLGHVKLTLDAGERSGKLVAELKDVTQALRRQAHRREPEHAPDARRSPRPDRAERRRQEHADQADPRHARARLRLGAARHQPAGRVLRPDARGARSREDRRRDDQPGLGLDRGRRHAQARDDLPRASSCFRRSARTRRSRRSRAASATGCCSRGCSRGPTNLLVLDEPTNDLDIESLEMLETTLQDYGGTLLLVSHDRTFLDNVVTQTLVAEGDGPVDRVSGRLQRLGGAAAEGAGGERARARRRARPERAAARAQRVKLSFREQRDLEGLPAEIEALEREQHALTERMSSADYHRQGPDAIKADRVRAEQIEHELAAKFERWSALEEKARQAAQP